MPKPNRAQRRAIQFAPRREAQREERTSLMEQYRTATARVEALKAKTPKSMWPKAWHVTS